MGYIGLNTSGVWIAVVLGAILAYGLGAVWYSPILYGKKWMKAQPHRKASDYTMTAVPMIMQAIASLFFALLVNVLIGFIGILPATLLMIGFYASESKAHSLFLGQKNELWQIDFGYRVGMILIIVLIRAIVSVFVG